MNQNASPREASMTARLVDRIIRAKAIYSMAQGRQVHGAIALRDEWIVAVSEDPHGLDGLISAGTHVVDEPGITIIPAFDDNHNHFILAAENLGYVQADQAHSIAELVELIRQRGHHSGGPVDSHLDDLGRVQSGRKTPADRIGTGPGYERAPPLGQEGWTRRGGQLPGPTPGRHHQRDTRPTAWDDSACR